MTTVGWRFVLSARNDASYRVGAADLRRKGRMNKNRSMHFAYARNFHAHTGTKAALVFRSWACNELD